jgi:uncharacterized membrane protein YciS (DUF1049 family)
LDAVKAALMMSRMIGLLFVLLVVLAGIAFHLRNAQPVVLYYFLDQAEMPFSVWLLLALTVGAVLGMLACLPALVSGRILIGRLRRRVQSLETPAQTPPAAGTSG